MCSSINLLLAFFFQKHVHNSFIYSKCIFTLLQAGFHKTNRSFMYQSSTRSNVASAYIDYMYKRKNTNLPLAIKK